MFNLTSEVSVFSFHFVLWSRVFSDFPVKNRGKNSYKRHYFACYFKWHKNVDVILIIWGKNTFWCDSLGRRKPWFKITSAQTACDQTACLAVKTDQLDLKAIFINGYLFNRSNSFQFELSQKSITDYRN